MQNLIESLEHIAQKQVLHKLRTLLVLILCLLQTLALDHVQLDHMDHTSYPSESNFSYISSFDPSQSNFSYISSFDGSQEVACCTPTEFPAYQSFPLDECNGSLVPPDNLTELLRSLYVNVIVEEKKRQQAECVDARMQTQIYRI